VLLDAQVDSASLYLLSSFIYQQDKQIVRLLGKMPTLAALAYHKVCLATRVVEVRRHQAHRGCVHAVQGWSIAATHAPEWQHARVCNCTRYVISITKGGCCKFTPQSVQQISMCNLYSCLSVAAGHGAQACPTQPAPGLH
jgi:hypothetical protein